MAQQFTAFHGAVYAVGFKPDGDTLTFKPDQPAAMAALPDSDGQPGRVVYDTERNGAASVRLQGVDALETHYQPSVADPRPPGASTPSTPKPSAGNHHQRLDLARGAAHALLGQLGVVATDADWHSWGYLRRVTVGGAAVDDKFQEGARAIVVSNGVDRNGRVLGWIFPSRAGLGEGEVLSEAALEARLGDCVNLALLSQGWAYPYFYYTLSAGLRGELSYRSSLAQRYRRGIWAHDASAAGVALPTLDALEQAVLHPYLFRKLLRTWRQVALETWYAGGDTSAAALQALPLHRLFDTGDPYLHRLSTRDFRRLGELLTVDGGVLRMSVGWRDLVFLD